MKKILKIMKAPSMNKLIENIEAFKLISITNFIKIHFTKININNFHNILN